MRRGRARSGGAEVEADANAAAPLRQLGAQGGAAFLDHPRRQLLLGVRRRGDPHRDALARQRHGAGGDLAGAVKQQEMLDGRLAQRAVGVLSQAEQTAFQ